MDREKLIKLLAMFSSDHDGEVVNAARLAHDMIQRSDTTWDEIVAPSSADIRSVLIALDRAFRYNSTIPQYDREAFLEVRDRYFAGKLSDVDERRLRYYKDLYATSSPEDDIPF